MSDPKEEVNALKTEIKDELENMDEEEICE